MQAEWRLIPSRASRASGTCTDSPFSMRVVCRGTTTRPLARCMEVRMPDPCSPVRCATHSSPSRVTMARNIVLAAAAVGDAVRRPGPNGRLGQARVAGQCEGGPGRTRISKPTIVETGLPGSPMKGHVEQRPKGDRLTGAHVNGPKRNIAVMRQDVLDYVVVTHRGRRRWSRSCPPAGRATVARVGLDRVGGDTEHEWLAAIPTDQSRQ